MYTGTTRTPIFAGPNADPPMIKFLPFWTVRPRAVVLAAEAALTAAILAGALLSARSNGGTDTSIGVVLGVTGGQAFLHLAGIDRTILDPNPMGFLRSVLGSLVLGLLLAGGLFVSFPAFSRGYSGGLIAWFATVGLVAAL